MNNPWGPSETEQPPIAMPDRSLATELRIQAELMMAWHAFMSPQRDKLRDVSFAIRVVPPDFDYKAVADLMSRAADALEKSK